MVRHAAEVDCGAFFALVGDLLDVDGTELVFEALWLTGWKFAARFYHIDANELIFAADDVNDT